MREGREDQVEFYRSLGFFSFEEEDPEAVRTIREGLDSLFADKFPEWKPFSSISHYLRITLEPLKKRDEGI